MTVRASIIVVLATLGAGALWLALSIATGLIFHLMPAAPMVVAVWVRRAVDTDAPMSWSSLVAHIAGGLIVVVVVATALTARGAPDDAEWLTGLVILIGVALATWLGRRVPG
ncbi:MAG: hypothetical protein E4H24_02805 [Thermomicrobiales bacterium]|jgi:hypothetical protein|nr:MAG: hypothetical protein E4H24_02805 [Thermomicrobiales bacterium]